MWFHTKLCLSIMLYLYRKDQEHCYLHVAEGDVTLFSYQVKDRIPGLVTKEFSDECARRGTLGRWSSGELVSLKGW